jgi:hypothetical protein
MSTNMQEYYREREHAERIAADRARDERSRAIHLKLADRYSALMGQKIQLTLAF